MDGALAVLMFMVGACLGVLIGMFVVMVRVLDRLEAMHGELGDLLREVADSAGEIGAEQGKHLDATGTVIVEQMRRIGRGLAIEIRDAGNQRQVLRAKAAEVPSAPLDRPPGRQRIERRPGESTLPPDAPAPQSGYLLEDLFPAHEQAKREEQHEEKGNGKDRLR